MASLPNPVSTAQPFSVNTASLHTETSPAFLPISWQTIFGSPTSPTSAITQGICTIPPGRTLKRHHHPQPESVYVLSGEALLEAGAFVDLKSQRDRVDSALTLTTPEVAEVRWSPPRRVKAGDAWFLPPNCPHKTFNDSEREHFVVLYTLAADRFKDVVYCYDE